MVKLVDRTSEVAALRALAKSRKPALALLLDHARPKEQRVFYFLAADTTSDQIESSFSMS